jgi:hypothetical protein
VPLLNDVGGEVGRFELAGGGVIEHRLGSHRRLLSHVGSRIGVGDTGWLAVLAS